VRAAGALAFAILLTSLGFARDNAALAQQSPAPPTTATDVLSRVESYWKNMESYKVPVVMSGSVKVKFISVPFRMDGTQYYQSPGKQALRLNNVPSLARGFENTVDNMGTPETWTVRYDITLTGTQQHGAHPAYVLVGTPKSTGNVKSVTLYVSEKTYAVQGMTFNYNNGATLVVAFSHHGLSPYHEPTSATINANFPGYSGNAQVQYGTYTFNVPIDPAVFQKQ
jgi:outer membrane lipoprotein-sorting protein